MIGLLPASAVAIDLPGYQAEEPGCDCQGCVTDRALAVMTPLQHRVLAEVNAWIPRATFDSRMGGSVIELSGEQVEAMGWEQAKPIPAP